MRFFLGFLMACSVGVGLMAQTRPQPEAPSAPAGALVTAQPTAVALEADARQVREQLRNVMMKYPPDLGRILTMDPTMLTNQQYLSQYPGLAQFLAAHPEIARNPGFYFDFVRASFDYTQQPMDAKAQAVRIWAELLQGFAVFIVTVFISVMVAWLLKTLLNHRKWLRTSRVQTEVHNKLLDRFASTNEVLTYVQSPAGRRFLEAAPIPVDGPIETGTPAPLNRILWSIQAGIVLTIGGFGFQYVSTNVVEEVAEGLWTIGVLAVALGLGFVVAGIFSYVMSRHLGLLEPVSPQAPRRDDPTMVGP